MRTSPFGTPFGTKKRSARRMGTPGSAMARRRSCRRPVAADGLTPEQRLVRKMYRFGLAPAEIACCTALPFEEVMRILDAA